MAATAARTSLLRSMATRTGMTVAAARAQSLRRNPLLLDGLHGRRPGQASSRHHSSSSSAPSGSTPPTANNKDLTQNKNVPSKLHGAKSASRPVLPAYLAYFMLYGAAAFLYFWVKPRFEELIYEIEALRTEKSILMEAAEECQRTHIKAQDVLADSSQAQSMQTSGE